VNAQIPFRWVRHLRRSWKDNIELVVREIMFWNIYFIALPQDRFNW
jgi:hypothetical protein